MYNEKRKNYTMKYLAKLKEVRFRVKPEEYEEMKKAAEKGGYPSMRAFFLEAIRNQMREEETINV